MSANTGVLNIQLKVDDKGSVTVRKFGNTAEEAGKKTDQSFRKAGKSLSTMNEKAVAGYNKLIKLAGAAVGLLAIRAAVTKIISVTKEWIALSNTQINAETKLQAVLKSTGYSAGYTVSQLKDMAGAMQQITTVGDEVTLAGMSILATFKQVRGEAFERATKAALDMSAVMGQDLNSTILQVGKALNDPTVGLTALSRAGVTFTEVQKDQIKTLQESGQMMEAQKVILAELESQFGGTAAAVADTFAGAQIQAANALGDVKEELGFVITRNEFFIELTRATTAEYVSWGNQIKENRQYLAELAKEGVLKVVDAIGWCLEALRFFHNGWLGIQLVGNAAVTALAWSLDKLYPILRKMLMPLDALFDGLVMLGKLDVNPFDSIAEGLGQFKDSSAEVTKRVAADIEKVNKQYDAAGKKIKNYAETISKIQTNTVTADPVVTPLNQNGKTFDDQMSHNQKLIEEFEDKYKKAMMSSFDYEVYRLRQKAADYKGAGADRIKVWKWTDAQIDKLREERDGKTKVKAIEVTKSLNEIIESSLSGVLSDSLTGQLDTVLDYAQGMTNSLASMWSGMMSKLVFNPGMKIGELSGGALWGAMGVAGVAIGGISSILNRKKEDEARRRELKRRRNALNSTMDDSIAGLTMSDISYEIYQTSKKLSDMAKEARKTGADLEKLNKLRELETDRLKEESAAFYKQQIQDAKSPFDSVINKYQDWATNRKQSGWGLEEWSAEIEVLGDQLAGLSSDNEKYFEVAEKQLDAMLTVVDLSEQQLQTYENTQKSLNSQIWELTSGGLSAATSSADYQARYKELFKEAQTLEPTKIAYFQSFISDYIDVMDTSGFDHNFTTNQVANDLNKLLVDIEDPMQALREAIELNTGAIGSDEAGLTGSINNMSNALITQMKIDRQIGMFERFTELAGGMDKPSISQSVGKIANPAFGSDSFDFGAKYIGNGVVDYSLESKDETNLMNTITAWTGFANSMEGLFDSLDMSMFTDDQKQIISNWQGLIDAIPDLYDPTDPDFMKIAPLAQEWYDWLKKWEGMDVQGAFSGMKYETPLLNAFAYGGYSTTPAIFAEAGPEWAVPAYNNPNNANFLRSVGADPEKIGQAVARSIMPILSGGSDKTIHVHVNVDGREIGNVVVEQGRSNPELMEMFGN